MTDRAYTNAKLASQFDLALIERCAGFAVADAACALARTLHGHQTGILEPATKEAAPDQIVRLQNLYYRARATGLSRDEFGKAANHHGVR